MSTNIKEEARRLIDQLPEDITWDDLMHEIYVHQTVRQASMTARLETPSTSRTSAPGSDWISESSLD